MRSAFPLVRFSLVLLALGSPGCSDRADLKVVESLTELFEQVPNNQVDILWVIDDSVSMAEEQQRVTEGMADFIGGLDASGVDFHLGVITTQADDDTAGKLVGEPTFLTAADDDYQARFEERVAVGAVTDGELESGLEAAILAMTAPLVDGVNAGFLREDARLSIIVLSDEDDCSDFGALGEDADTFDCTLDGAALTPVAELVGMLRDAKGIGEGSSLLQFSGIVGPEVGANCPAAQPGERYAEAIGLTAGLEGNICETDYSGIMNGLGLEAAVLQTTFLLSRTADASSISVTVTDVDGSSWSVGEDAANGWTYSSDEEASRLTFQGEGVPPRGSTFTVYYEISAESSGVVVVE